MQIVLFIILTLIFFYSLYKFVKDDYIFIRKNISLEQIFDVAFGTFWVSLLFARIFYFVFHPITSGENFLFVFFSPGEGGISLLGGVVGGIIGLYLIGKYKKVPLGRFYDFLTLSFLITLPLGFFSFAPFMKGMEFYLYLASGLIYLILLLFFMKLFYPDLMKRTLREGNLSIFFFIFFFLISLFYSMIQFKETVLLVITPQSIFATTFLFFSIILLIKQEVGSLHGKKSSTK